MRLLQFRLRLDYQQIRQESHSLFCRIHKQNHVDTLEVCMEYSQLKIDNFSVKYIMI